ncbi:MAG: von Willebrand factor type A domain-containing protein [Huintestinicola sp.]|uniref:vWA domain-containing protein n=1 Tax=Huintestinicola sp. TaxID=2981661 RepID=UPI003EFF7FFE
MTTKRTKLIRMISALTAISLITACGGASDMETASGDSGMTKLYPETNDGAYETYPQTTAANNAVYETSPIHQAIQGDAYEEAPNAEEAYVYEKCFDEAAPAADDSFYTFPEEYNTEEYNYIEENGYTAVSSAPLSTFSADVDTASYTNIRRMIYDGYDVPPEAVRIEEMINYFDYHYSDPDENEPFAVHAELSDCPWNKDTELLMIGINTKSTDALLDDREPMNLVFLIDVSGSMYSEDKLPLVQKSFSMLTDNLNSRDRISIVTYAGSDEVVLEGADGNDRERVLDAINSLEAGGSTAGAAGINTAYEIAEKYFIKGGNNRVILATDGDLNVGLSSESELTQLIEEKRESGVFLSVLGFGTGNLKDNKLEALADHGNGNYSYIDSEREARKVLVDEMSGTLYTAAKDVKFQLEFNPANIKGYRLIGYENRTMAAEDFNDDTKDAGEIGAGHSVTVLYELVPVDSPMEIGSELKYSENQGSKKMGNELLTVNIRYKEPEGSESKLLSYPVERSLYSKTKSENMTFAAAVAEFGMLLRNSRYIGDITYSNIATQLSEYDYHSDEFKDEFVYLVNTMKRRAVNSYND